MRSIFFCSLLLCSMFVAAQTTKQWKTIQIKTVTGSANVESETLFTPTTAGPYRISATFVGAATESPTSCVVSFSWRDRLEQGGYSLLKTGVDTSWGSTVFMFNPVAGKPLTYGIEIYEGAVSGYRLDVTVEELE